MLEKKSKDARYKCIGTNLPSIVLTGPRNFGELWVNNNPEIENKGKMPSTELA
jgi:hypothetical protein